MQEGLPRPSDDDAKKTVERRAARALGLAQLEEFFACASLEGAPVALGDEKTWKAFSDETKRPRRQRHPIWKTEFSQWFLLTHWS